MFTTTIPHFKEVVIMSNSCDVCGYRDSEVKPGGGFSDQGRIITLKAPVVFSFLDLRSTRSPLSPLRTHAHTCRERLCVLTAMLMSMVVVFVVGH
jgi:hypothetical protein